MFLSVFIMNLKISRIQKCGSCKFLFNNDLLRNAILNLFSNTNYFLNLLYEQTPFYQISTSLQIFIHIWHTVHIYISTVLCCFHNTSSPRIIYWLKNVNNLLVPSMYPISSLSSTFTVTWYIIFCIKYSSSKFYFYSHMKD